MSRDPYHDVKKEVVNSLDYIKSLHTSFQRLQQQSTSGSSTNRQQLIEEARSELIGHLDFIQGDVDDLQASVEAVQESGSRWGISDAEVKERKRFLNEVVDNVRDIRADAESYNRRSQESSAGRPPSYRRGSAASSSSKGKQREEYVNVELGRTNDGSGRYRDSLDKGNGSVAEADEYEMEQQQMMIRQQDSTMGVIAGTLSSLATQAGLIGQEVSVQNEMLDDLELRIDATDSRLTKANKRLKAFIRANEDTKSTYCIGILIIILIVLLLLVILT